MKITVCVKIVRGEINPFDAAALETALRLDGAQTTVVSMGPTSTLPVLRSLTRLGDFRTVLISDEKYAGSDTLATSRILAAALERLGPDLVFCGRQSIDGETAQVGPGMAAMLGFPFLGNVMEFDPVQCRTRTGTVKIPFPCVLGFERILQLRFPSLRVVAKNVEIWNNENLDLDPGQCGLAGSPTRVLETFESDHGRRSCRFLGRDELAPLLRSLLEGPRERFAANRTVPGSVSDIRFPEVWAVGPEVAEIASTIAERVIVQEKTPVSSIVEKAGRERPEVVLWNADPWGRATAPQAAAMLETGLCADCTKLAVVEENGQRILEMYRPALGGNVTARIRCRSLPVMATVRTGQASERLIVAAGRGVAERFDEVRRFAARYRAGLAASRALVDMGVAPYEIQVGLTGRHVSPDVYLGLGISGTVQHLCAVENAGTIVAVNPDKNARIFDFADYGIVDRF